MVLAFDCLQPSIQACELSEDDFSYHSASSLRLSYPSYDYLTARRSPAGCSADLAFAERSRTGSSKHYLLFKSIAPPGASLLQDKEKKILNSRLGAVRALTPPNRQGLRGSRSKDELALIPQHSFQFPNLPETRSGNLSLTPYQLSSSHPVIREVSEILEFLNISTAIEYNSSEIRVQITCDSRKQKASGLPRWAPHARRALKDCIIDWRVVPKWETFSPDKDVRLRGQKGAVRVPVVNL